MAGLVGTELPEYILSDLIPMEEEIDNWVNHDFWYTNQCIDHYDTDIPFGNVTDNTTRQLSKSSDKESCCASQEPNRLNVGSGSVLKNLLVENGQNAQFPIVPALKVEVDNPVTSMYMIPNEPTIFVPSPTIPIQSQSTHTDSGVMSESIMSGSSCSSPVPSVTPSEAESIYIQEGQMINFLRSDKGLEMFAKAHDMTKEELINFLESKRNGEDFYHNNHASPIDNEEKHEEDNPKRRRHRGTYSKSTCLQVIDFVKRGYSARAAAKKFGIPKSTVHNWLHEDVSTRPEKGHRKKDLHHEKSDEAEHDYHKNMTDLGQSFAQTTIKDEPKFRFSNEGIKVQQNPNSTISVTPITSQSALVQLLTTNNRPNVMKTEPEQDNIGFTEADMDCLDLGVIDEILHPEDWIGHEKWYKEQYHNHYNRDSLNGKQRKSYGTYSNEHRMKATEFVKSGRTLSAASKEFNIPKSTIHTWLNEGNVPCELPPELENVVVEEIEQSKDGHNSPSLAAIKKKAEEVAVPHMEKFRPSFAWCRDFMKRHYMDRNDGVDAKKICLEDMKSKACINDLVSVLGLDSTSKDGLTSTTKNLNSTSLSSPGMKAIFVNRTVEPNRNEANERIS